MPAPGARRPDDRDGAGADVDAVFAALSDPTRRRLLDEISRDGPLTATELAPGYPITRQAVVKHLSALAHAGLVAGEREGRDVRYRVVAGRLGDATAWLEDVGQRWDERLTALQRRFTSTDISSADPP